MRTIEVTLPTLHEGQVRAYRLKMDARGGAWDANAGGRFKAVRCGRRWGKTTFGETWIGDGAIRGEPCGWFAPAYKYVSEVYQELKETLAPVITNSSKTDGVIRTLGGGRIDFWTLENEDAGRSRMYRRVFIDESAFTNANMMDVWKRSIKPTLLDLNGRVIAASNTRGVQPDNFLWQICNQPEHGFIEYHARSIDNPLIPRRMPGESEEDHFKRRLEAFEDLRKREHPLVFSQEYEAEFIDWSGVSFFSADKLLVDGRPVEPPIRCDAIFAVVDSATKTGTSNDGTAVTWFAITKHGYHPLVILDWDVVQIEGAFLEDWLPSVAVVGEQLALQYRSRTGFLGAYIEDKDSGQILLQQADRRGLNAIAIESPLTAAGKDGRALSVSGYVYTGQVKFTTHAYEKTVTFKETTRNHLWSQVTGFKMGDKEASKRADDLLDTFTYGVAIALGNEEGW